MKKAILLIVLVLTIVLCGCSGEDEAISNNKEQNDSEVVASLEKEPETKPEQELKPEPKPEIKPEPKPEIKLEPEPELKPEPELEPKPEPKSEPKPEPKSEPKPEPKLESEGKLYGIAFLGYGEEYYEADLSSYLPVIEHNGVETIFLDGHSFFLLIPASEDIFFEIYGIGKDSNGEETRWQAAETYPGSPVLVRCNDWYDPPSALVHACGGDEYYDYFTPTYIGRESRIKLEEGAYELKPIE